MVCSPLPLGVTPCRALRYHRRRLQTLALASSPPSAALFDVSWCCRKWVACCRSGAVLGQRVEARLCMDTLEPIHPWPRLGH